MVSGQKCPLSVQPPLHRNGHKWICFSSSRNYNFNQVFDATSSPDWSFFCIRSVCVDRYLGVGGHGRHQSGVETCSRSGRAVQSGGEVGANRGGLCVHKVEDCAQGGRKKQVNPSLARMQDGRPRRNSCRHICHHRREVKPMQPIMW